MSVKRLPPTQRQQCLTLETMAAMDARLSFRARGLHAFLMTQPDDYAVTLDRLAQESPTEGKDALRPALQELLQAGYLRRARGRAPGGILRGWETTVYETPNLLAEAPAPGAPLAGRHSTGRQGSEADQLPYLDLLPLSVESPPSVVVGLPVPDTPRPEEASYTLDTPAPARPQRTLQPHRRQTQAEEVLAYMNTVHGRQFRDTTQIAKLLAREATVEECYLVIDWSFAIDRLENPKGYEKYFNTTSPFRFANFDRLLDRARRWDAAGRPSYEQQQLQALAQESLLDHPTTARHLAGAQQAIERFHSRHSNGSLFGLPTSTQPHTGDHRD